MFNSYASVGAEQEVFSHVQLARIKLSYWTGRVVQTTMLETVCV